MKKFFVFLSIILIGLFSYAETLNQILAKNYATRGGLEKLRSVKTIYFEGKMVNSQQNNEIQMKMWYKKPNKVRNEVNLMGKKIVQAYNGKEAWWIMPFISPEPKPIPEEQAKYVKEMSSNIFPLVDYQKEGSKLELVGKDDVEGTEAYKLKLTTKSGKIIYYYLDADSGIELKAETNLSKNGVESKSETYFSDYKKVNGIYFPFYIETKSKGLTAGKIVFSTIKLNLNIDDSIFDMPKPKKTETKKHNK